VQEAKTELMDAIFSLQLPRAAGYCSAFIPEESMSATPWPSWVSAADATDEEDKRELAPQMPTATKTAAQEAPRTLLAAHRTVDVRHVEKASMESCDDLFAADATLGDKGG
jgi:hypothetical protein